MEHYHWIDGVEALPRLEEAMAAAPWMALDTESNSFFVYQEALCLVQLNLGGELYLVDPLAFESPAEALAPVKRWWQQGKEIWLHGGEYDVAVLKRELGEGPERLFDTQMAASLLNMKRTGYANLVSHYFGVELSKKYQRFNWGRRPIPDGPKHYALDDVIYLPELVARLQDAVREADIEEEVALACAMVASSEAHQSTPLTSTLWSLRGREKVRRSELPVAWAAIQWRERIAKELNRPAGLILSRKMLGMLAKSPPTGLGDLKRLGLSPAVVSRGGDALLAALKNPPPAPEPPPKPEPDPERQARERRLKQWRQKEAERRKTNIQTVLPTQALDMLAKDPGLDLHEVAQIGPKRIARYGAAIQALL